MMSYLILFALIGMTIYYSYSAYKDIKAFIEKKRAEKNKSSQKNDIVYDISDTFNDQSHDN